MDAAIFGLIVADLIAEPMDLRQPTGAGGLAVLNSIQLTTGGNACNVAVAMAKLGMRVATAGLVGDDLLGQALLGQLRLSGVDTAYVATKSGAQTCASIVAVEPGGERVFFHTPGVTSLLDVDAFRSCFPLFKRCGYVQIGYFGLLPTLVPQLPQLLAELRQFAPRTKIAPDTANPPAAVELLWPILQYVDLFCPSRVEAMVLSGEHNPAAMASVFLRQMPPDALVAIKLDADGCYVTRSGVSHFVPAYRIEAVDTTGAGDTWYAGLLTGLIKGMPLHDSARLANRAAADCCTAFGALTGVRSFEQTVNDLYARISLALARTANLKLSHRLLGLRAGLW